VFAFFPGLAELAVLAGNLLVIHPEHRRQPHVDL